MGYRLAMREKDILPFATAWMDLRGIVLSELSQGKTDSVYHIYLESKELNLLETDYNDDYQGVGEMWRC